MKVLVGMSGGVDSSVAAALLLRQGHEVSGVYVEAYNEPGCRTDQDRKDAVKVAAQLSIPLTILDYKRIYAEEVVEYFYDTYAGGQTPNPDVRCNRQIKFGKLFDYMKEQKYDYLATGHYARIWEENGTGFVQRGRDEGKDQSYFLWQVGSERLKRVLFPLGDKLKREVREIARDLLLPNADKPESMGVCMMGELKVEEKLRERLGEKEGDVIWEGEVVGKHRGLWFYTIGQRGEWGIEKGKLKKIGREGDKLPILYVIGKKSATNSLVIGERKQAMTRQIRLAEVGWYMNRSETDSLAIRIRNLGELVPVVKLLLRGEQCEVETKEEMFGVAPGQSGVFYRKTQEQGGEIVVGGGIIGV